ncbi:MAG: hypothetical protein HYY04_03165 [Chloroflexi bacterium]|nr:hypothetical protein [Chloroflexota bacterium]
MYLLKDTFPVFRHFQRCATRPVAMAAVMNEAPCDTPERLEDKMKNSTSNGAIVVFVVILLVYFSTARSYFIYCDDLLMYGLTESIVDRGDIALDDRYHRGWCQGMQGTDGRRYSFYGIAPSLVAVPFYMLGKAVAPHLRVAVHVDQDGHERRSALVFLVSMANAVTTALACTLLFLLARKLDYQASVSAVLAAFLGFGTMMWHYSTLFLSEPLTTAALILGVLGLIAYPADGQRRWLVLSGVGLGTAIAARSLNVLLIPIMALYILHELKRRRRAITLPALALWLTPIGIWLVIIATYNYLRFGSALEGGYFLGPHSFTTPLYVGLYGLLLSPGKSIFLYNPVLVLGLVAFSTFWRKHRYEALLLVGIILAYLIPYSLWRSWPGGGVWGPRLLLPTIPFVLLAAAPVLADISHWSQGVVVGALGVATIVVQVTSVLVPFWDYPRYVGLPVSLELLEKSLWNPMYSPVKVHLAVFLRGTFVWDLAFVQYQSPVLQVAQALATILAMTVVALTVRHHSRIR